MPPPARAPAPYSYALTYSPEHRLSRDSTKTSGSARAVTEPLQNPATARRHERDLQRPLPLERQLGPLHSRRRVVEQPRQGPFPGLFGGRESRERPASAYGAPA